jgi:FixJ family two-component response regulator
LGILKAMSEPSNKPLKAAAIPEGALICVVDDDQSVREALPDLLREFGFSTKAFASAGEFLKSGTASTAKCLILDVAMPAMTGPELHRELIASGHSVPVVFITARADPIGRQQLIKQGAVDCLFKPFSEQALKAALDTAMRVRH